MKFTPLGIATAIGSLDHTINRIVVSRHLAHRMIANRFKGNPFDNYFDLLNDQMPNKSLIGYVWSFEVFVDDFNPDCVLRLEGPNGHVNLFTVQPE